LRKYPIETIQDGPYGDENQATASDRQPRRNPAKVTAQPMT
jgi:hypothetical protein